MCEIIVEIMGQPYIAIWDLYYTSGILCYIAYCLSCYDYTKPYSTLALSDLTVTMG